MPDTAVAHTDVQWYIDHRLVHEIHTSERKSFRACRRRWDWIFRESYYPKMTAKPLEFGTAYHTAMEAYYDPDKWNWDREVMAAYAIKVFTEKCRSQKKKALQAMQQEGLDPDVEQDYHERVQLGQGMLKYYFEKVAPKIDKGWKPIKVEIAFMLPIPHPETKQDMWCKCDTCKQKWRARPDLYPLELLQGGWGGLPVVYAGRLDCLAEDMHGDYWIIDWKTARNVSKDDEFLYLDDQVGSYPWALKKLGIPVRGFVYHEQRKGFPEPPNRNKQRRLGCLFSVSKQQDTDYDTFVATVSTEDKDAYEAGAYDGFLRWLQEEGVEYYKRHQIHKSAEELEEIEINIGNEALDMIDPAIRIYPSPGRFGCNFCAFRQPCLERNARGDYQYALDTLYERREHYYIREEPSTESKGAE
jgi:hypothetical protein